MTRVVVVNVGTGNVGSVANMLRRIGAEVTVAHEEAEITDAPRLVLPGVGAFDTAMSRLTDSGLLPALERRAQDDAVPVLGICLGMQLFADGSDEGERPGLGWIPGRVRRLPSVGPEGPLRIPHMGWNRLHWTRDTPLTGELADDARFYFVHSYAFEPVDSSVTLAVARYGDDVTAVVQDGHITGVQFHPEKSHRHGQAMLTSWLGL